MILWIYSTPILTTTIIFIFGRYLGYKGNKILGVVGIGTSMLVSIKYLIRYIRKGEISRIKVEEWGNMSSIKIPMTIELEKATIIMLLLITTFTFFILIYSYWYLEEDSHLSLFIACLVSFAYSMGILVSAGSWILLFIGWELVGLFSFFLILYWSNSISNTKSGLKALLFNKVGDILLLLSIISLINYSSSLEITSTYNILDNPYFFTITIFLAAIIKSAQILFHPWLSDAMAGPTPVSSLLHAATMVTAGIYLLIRVIENEKLELELMNIAIPFGLITSIFAGLIAFNQKDFKKLIAFSTCSHLGLMLLSLTTNPEIGLLHIFSHAFFKSLLFLTSGLLIHLFSSYYSLAPSQDIRSYSLVSYIAPYYSILLLIASLSLMGLPSLSGSLSKERILYLNWITNEEYFLVLLGGGLVSLLYVYKLFKLFFKESSSSLFNPSLYIHIPKINYSLIGTKGLSYFFFSSILLSSFFLNIFLSPLDSLFNIESLLPFNNLSGIISRALGIELILLLGLCLAIGYSISKKWKRYIITILNLRFFIDYLQSYIIYFPILSSSYFIFLKSIDRGLLEWIGPLGISRLIESFINKEVKIISPKLILLFLIYIIIFIIYFFYI